MIPAQCSACQAPGTIAAVRYGQDLEERKGNEPLQKTGLAWVYKVAWGVLVFD